jgi:metal-responsive CopG/Arc/MetJ family transcriptional regulator
MKRTDIYLTEEQLFKLDKERKDISRAELIRRIIDSYYEQKGREVVKNDND